MGIVACYAVFRHFSSIAKVEVYENAVSGLSHINPDRLEAITARLARLAIADENLSNCILVAVAERENTSRDADNDDPQNLTHLYCRGRNINSLAGIEKLTYLSYVDISINNIENISPIKELSSLKILNISANPIQDISPLKYLPELEKVTLPDVAKLDCEKINTILTSPTTKTNRDCDADENMTAKQNNISISKLERKKKHQLSESEEKELLEYELSRNRF
ncbi:MAG: Leucine-rich repeat (LRR) protein [Lentisphaeria bacterium]